jgi:hypothetical protein
MSQNIEELANKETMIERFKEAVEAAEPGQVVIFTFRKPLNEQAVEESKPKPLTVDLIKGPAAKTLKELFDKSFAENEITEPGYVAMDADGTWYYYKNLPVIQFEDDDFFMFNEGNDRHIELFNINLKEMPVDWRRSIRYVY